MRTPPGPPVELWVWRTIEGTHKLGGERELLWVAPVDDATIARVREGFLGPGRYRLEYRDARRLIRCVERLRVRRPKPPRAPKRRAPEARPLPAIAPRGPVLAPTTQRLDATRAARRSQPAFERDAYAGRGRPAGVGARRTVGDPTDRTRVANVPAGWRRRVERDAFYPPVETERGDPQVAARDPTPSPEAAPMFTARVDPSDEAADERDAPANEATLDVPASSSRWHDRADDGAAQTASSIDERSDDRFVDVASDAQGADGLRDESDPIGNDDEGSRSASSHAAAVTTTSEPEVPRDAGPAGGSGNER